MSSGHWETFYRSGALATGPSGNVSGYDLELREVWIEFFSALPDGARILDIGTGNGAIALIARETAVKLGRDFEIQGADLAHIDPMRDVPGGARLLAGIRFHAGVSNAQMPFPAQCFDAVSGQYALEYGEIGPGLREIFRVLKDGGRAQFVLHHSESVILRNAAESLQHADLVFNGTKIFRKLRRLLEAERKPRNPKGRTGEELAAALAQLQAAGKAKSALILHVTVDAVQKLLNARRQLHQATIDQQLDRMEAEIRASVRRLKDLVASAQSAEGIAGVRSEAETIGFTGCDVQSQFHARTNLVGWRVNLDKP